MLPSLLCILTRRMLELVALRFRSRRSKDLELETPHISRSRSREQTAASWPRARDPEAVAPWSIEPTAL